MSWGEYLTRMKKDGLKHAAICGSDNASWIQVSEGSNVRNSSWLIHLDWLSLG